MVIGAPTAVPHHAAVQHAGDTHVLHVYVLPAGLGRYVDARGARTHDLMRTIVLDGRMARKRHTEAPVADQLPISDRLTGIAHHRHHTAGHGQLFDGHPQLGGGEFQ